MEIENFKCVSKEGIRLFLSANVSLSGASVNGLARMWKIYMSCTNDRWASICVMFNTLAPIYSLGAFPISSAMIGSKIFNLSSKILPQNDKDNWFGMNT